MVKLNGKEFEFDVFEEKNADKYQKSLEKFYKDVEKYNESGKDTKSLATTIRRQCKLVFDFLDNLFGEGACYEIFGESVNLKTCMEVFASCVEQISAEIKDIKSAVENTVIDINKNA